MNPLLREPEVVRRELREGKSLVRRLQPEWEAVSSCRATEDDLARLRQQADATESCLEEHQRMLRARLTAAPTQCLTDWAPRFAVAAIFAIIPCLIATPFVLLTMRFGGSGRLAISALILVVFATFFLAVCIPAFMPRAFADPEETSEAGPFGGARTAVARGE